MRSALDWFPGLHVAQKVLAALFGGLLRFSVTYLITSGVLWLLFADPEEPTSDGGGSGSEEASVSDEQFATPPRHELED